MRSSEVASRAGVNVQTLRYYERRGILPEPKRSGSGYRAYDDQAVRTAPEAQIGRSVIVGFARLVELV
jgi:DNA-binding transcriptional MerR regulator